MSFATLSLPLAVLQPPMTAKIKRHKLEFDFEYDFDLIGISCHKRDYQICWSINKALGIELARGKDIHVIKKQTKKTEIFAAFYWLDDDTETEFLLFSNRHPEGFLVPEQMQFDYFLMLRENFNFDAAELTTKIRSIKHVLMASPVDVDSLKSKENLLF